jgi:hypothetical protein
LAHQLSLLAGLAKLLPARLPLVSRALLGSRLALRQQLSKAAALAPLDSSSSSQQRVAAPLAAAAALGEPWCCWRCCLLQLLYAISTRPSLAGLLHANQHPFSPLTTTFPILPTRLLQSTGCWQRLWWLWRRSAHNNTQAGWWRHVADAQVKAGHLPQFEVQAATVVRGAPHSLATLLSAQLMLPDCALLPIVHKELSINWLQPCVVSLVFWKRSQLAHNFI